MADQRITQLTQLSAQPAANDLLVVVDVSDTTMAASGTNKKIPAAYVVTTTGNAATVSGGGTITLGGNDLTVAKTGSAAFVDTVNGYLLKQTFNAEVVLERTTATIAAGAFTADSSNMVIDTEGGAASDDLTTISAVTTGQFLILQTANSSRDIVVKHGTGNIFLNGRADFTLTGTRDKLFLIGVSTEWHEIGRGDNSV